MYPQESSITGISSSSLNFISENLSVSLLDLKPNVPIIFGSDVSFSIETPKFLFSLITLLV